MKKLKLFAEKHKFVTFIWGNVKEITKNNLGYKQPVTWVLIVSVLIILYAEILLSGIPQAISSQLSMKDVESITHTNVLIKVTPGYSIKAEDWPFIINLINSSKRSLLAKPFQPNNRNYTMYSIDVKLKKQADTKKVTYRLLFYRQDHWDIFHGKRDYRLALTRSTESGKSEIWGLPDSKCYHLNEWSLMVSAKEKMD